MAEWLRRLTRNQIPSGSVGSNPTDCEKQVFVYKFKTFRTFLYRGVQFKCTQQQFIFSTLGMISGVKL